MQSKETAVREEFSIALAEKEEDIKKKASRMEQAEQRLTTLNLELKAAESKIKNYDVETSTLKLEIKELGEKAENANSTARSAESKARILEQEKIHLEQKYRSKFNRFEELQERCKSSENNAKRASEKADDARAEAATAQEAKSEFEHVAMERLAQIERAKWHAKMLERQTGNLAKEVEQYRAAERDALNKVEMLEEKVRDKEKETDSLLQSNNSQRENNAEVLESLLDSERVAHAEANNRAKALSVQLQATQGKLDELSQELATLRYGDKRTGSHAKRGRTDDYEMGVDLVHDTGMPERVTRGNKRSKSTTSPMKFASPEDGGSVFRGPEQINRQQTNTEDYTQFTMTKLRKEIADHGFGDELLQFKNPSKADLLALYERLVLEKNK